ncbi:DUF2092 domain-containing protein [Hoeflea sp. WL0058]|uniref:DUF2092 domain-containing protein n=2 Tax=Flavimaribacter sediminis TaxID=2865987 RepID=A0AAE3D0B8_9HYPH|nr:DUF2092 domain-containing protein [Flavimaribacter sediminis]
MVSRKRDEFRFLVLVALSFFVLPSFVGAAAADENDARNLLKAMSDYVGAQQRVHFDYNANLEVVTSDGQKLGVASSGTVTLERPDKLRATRKGGFADLEMLFDGTTVTLYGRAAKLYTQVQAPGTIDQLIDTLRDKYSFALPAADLLLSNPYDELMAEVTDIKDLGSGFIDDVECDHLAFRTKDVDWQIWIARGRDPYPCRYEIASKKVSQAPQYRIDVRNWKTEGQVPMTGFEFKPGDATEVDIKTIRAQFADLPPNFSKGDSK